MPLAADLLQKLARKYVWWKKPEEAAAHPERIVAQVMNIGGYDDVQSLVHRVGLPYLREVLARAEAGQFDARSWTYWHYRLGLSDLGQVPALPQEIGVMPELAPCLDVDSGSAASLAKAEVCCESGIRSVRWYRRRTKTRSPQLSCFRFLQRSSA